MTLESNSADSDSEEPQNREDEPQSESLTWQNIEIDENKMAALKGVIEEIVNSSEKVPLADQIIEAAKAVSKISSGINAIIIPLRSLVRITDPLLSSGYRTTRRISNGL